MVVVVELKFVENMHKIAQEIVLVAAVIEVVQFEMRIVVVVVDVENVLVEMDSLFSSFLYLVIFLACLFQEKKKMEKK
jgi:hypothetical protein